MKIRTIFFLLGQGITNLFKNQLMSIAAVTTISACLFVISVFYVIGENVTYMLDTVETNLGMEVFFEDGTTEEEILEIKEVLEAREEVHKIDYISAEEAWARFKEDLFQGKEDQLAGFETENPLADSASLIVYIDDLDTRQTLSDYIEALPLVHHLKKADQVMEVMESFNQLIRYASVALITILVIISLFLIANTVRLGISTRKKEIEIMKYIGARDSFIKGPFIIEGILIGLVGSFIPLGLVWYFYKDVTQALTKQFGLLSSYLVFLDIKTLYIGLAPIAIGVGILIGVIGSRVTVSKYLKV